jgi:surface antigen
MSIGSQADQRDCAAAQAALAQLTTQPIGVAATWTSPSGSHGDFTPVSAEYAQGTQFCRKVRANTDIVGHAPVQTTGIACRDANGDYQTMTEEAANTPPQGQSVN